MFFWQKEKSLKNNQKTSLQASQNYPNMTNAGLLNPKSKESKRTFSFSPSEKKASVCVEASLSFSFFLFFFINIFSTIMAFVFFSTDLTSLQQQGKKVAAKAYITRELWEDNEDLIVLKKQRVVNSPFNILPLPEYKLVTKCVVKPWVGYRVTKIKSRNEEEIWVYVTEYGTVYHKRRDCAHLSLSISVSSISEIDKEKNKSGEYYQPCEFCGNNSFVTAVYVTSYGTKYHTTMNCRGLKRTVISVPISTVEGKSVCKKCG